VRGKVVVDAELVVNVVDGPARAGAVPAADKAVPRPPESPARPVEGGGAGWVKAARVADGSASTSTTSAGTAAPAATLASCDWGRGTLSREYDPLRGMVCTQPHPPAHEKCTVGQAKTAWPRP